ncbi:MAG: hypothetical protein Q9219_000915 [cf. Caloplaca sp. 3 TL-2023]
MSSIFTFDPDPPKVLFSPWPAVPAEQPDIETDSQHGIPVDGEDHLVRRLADFGVSSLQPEPQEGSTEYKLHLLLRPRRNFAALSTVRQVPGSHLSKPRLSKSEGGTPSSMPLPKLAGAPASSNQSRQTRLQNLTTQLLWRLQQSSPHHPASKADLVIPELPNVSGRIDRARSPATLLPGLGDSQGALYEIGVADDGTIVGLADDELNESLEVLRAMANSLGCRVEVVKRIIVGDCQWLDDTGKSEETTHNLRTETLWVVEALVSPGLPVRDPTNRSLGFGPDIAGCVSEGSSLFGQRETRTQTPRTDQIRISLTGSTTSGKSSLLGTLSTSTLDNGRGKSRLSLLKHRHEIASGVTSSVTGSLIGYRNVDSAEDDDASRVEVVNHASGNVSSWTDIHCASEPGRLVFLNDSAGHPRFRRTTVRGLVSWAPHWTICCIAADSEERLSGQVGATASASDILGSSHAEVDLATAHLELCLNLGLQLIVVITKLDLASISALKPTLGKVLSVLKSAGRRPEILSSPSDEQLFLAQSIGRNDELEVINLLSAFPGAGMGAVVPIVLTSSVTGKGIDKVHALLCHLPIPKRPGSSNGSHGARDQSIVPSTLFHIDEIFATNGIHKNGDKEFAGANIDSILSGCLQRGTLSVGQDVFIGPFSTSHSETDSPTQKTHWISSYPKPKESTKSNASRRILRRPLSGDFALTSEPSQIPAPGQHGWRKFRVCSIRNLSLPVRGLLPDQVGTVGLCLPDVPTDTGDIPPTSEDRIRKGMVLVNIPSHSNINSLQAHKGFVALVGAFETSIYHAGSPVVVYFASIRAPARLQQSEPLQRNAVPANQLSVLEDSNDEGGQPLKAGEAVVDFQQSLMTLHFTTTQEWFELGSRVLIMPASGFGTPTPGERGDKSSAGLDGLVGTIVQGL